MKIIPVNDEINIRISAKPSKSHEQRLLAGALLSREECCITNFGNSDDVIAARNIISILGSNSIVENNNLKIYPVKQSDSEILDCNESALCARLFASIACLFKNKFIITGRGSLLNREIAEDYKIFEEMGCKLSFEKDSLPVTFKNARLKNGTYIIDGNKTSQIISGLILSLTTLKENSKLIIKNPASIPYILMTLQIAKDFGIKTDYKFSDNNELIIEIYGNQKYSPGTFNVEGDWSGISFFLVAGALCGNISVTGLNPDSLQADSKILDVFDLANIKYYWKNNLLYVEKSNIKAFEFDAHNCPDLIPAIVILALFANGESTIFGTKRLLFKESSRAEILIKELSKIGAKIKFSDNTLKIEGGNGYKYSIVNSHNDHRIAMALAIAGLKTEGGIEIKNPECVSKSYPDFFSDLELYQSKSGI